MTEFLNEKDFALGINGLSIVDSSGVVQYSFPITTGSRSQSLVLDSTGNLIFETIDSNFIGGIGLQYDDISVETISASGSGSLSYSNLTGTFTFSPSDLSVLDSLSSVAFSGNYTDLSNKPLLAVVATSGSYTDLLDKPNLFQGTYDSISGTPSTPDAFPTGGIIMWSGSVGSIPSGWALCDGANGTPDLRNRFIVGAGLSYNVAATGGSPDAVAVSHTHTVSDPGHSHSIPATNTGVRWNAGGLTGGNFTALQTGSGNSTGSQTTGISINSSGESGTNKNLPPYYALAYIMKT